MGAKREQLESGRRGMRRDSKSVQNDRNDVVNKDKIQSGWTRTMAELDTAMNRTVMTVWEPYGNNWNRDGYCSEDSVTSNDWLFLHQLIP